MVRVEKESTLDFFYIHIVLLRIALNQKQNIRLEFTTALLEEPGIVVPNSTLHEYPTYVEIVPNHKNLEFWGRLEGQSKIPTVLDVRGCE